MSSTSSLSRDWAKGLLRPPSASGEPSSFAEKAGSTKLSTTCGRLEMKGSFSSMSLTLCFSSNTRSSNSMLPPLTWMLFSEKAGVGDDGPERNSSSRSEML